jgi:tetratricopeptide (TPR) repeat protein
VDIKTRLLEQWRNTKESLRMFFLVDKPTVSAAALPFAVVANILFFRHPRSNFIFDEQEALLANPYVRSVMDAKPKFLWRHAFTTDFWGRLPEATIGSYRPLPNLIWRSMWWITQKFMQLAQKVSPNSATNTPLLCAWVNLILHGINGALVTVLVFACTRSRPTAWLAGLLFTSCAVLTEAVSGVVGLADILGSMGALFALVALRLNTGPMLLGTFLAVLLGLFSKESALCCVPLVPFAAFLLSPYFHPEKPRRLWRALVAAIGSGEAFVFYVEIRRKLFPIKPPAELLPDVLDKQDFVHRVAGTFLRWYGQPALPRDALNNPLVEASMPLRVAGALRVFARGMGQVLFPLRLSGDYSAPQEPIPDSPVFFLSVVGGAVMALAIPLALLFALLAFIRYWRRGVAQAGPSQAFRLVTQDRRPLIGLALTWMVVSYFPVSNIPILLPTVRAERFWYFPAIGTSILLALFIMWVLGRLQNLGDPRTRLPLKFGRSAVVLFVGFQFFAARYHACDYSDDLAFWNATQKAVPNSSKAHLNYSVMLGARGKMEERLVANKRAIELQPKWAMANVYLGDTLCRMHRAPEAVEPYKVGFELSPNDVSLLALAMQCLWDEGLLQKNVKDETFEPSDTLLALIEAGNKHSGSWYAWMVNDIRDNGQKNKGVDPKHRPRGYNEGPRE